MKTAIVINPIAGSGPRVSPGQRVDLAWRLLKAHHAEGDICISEHPGHATELARDRVRGGCSLIVAWGGDGTVNEVATALVHQDAALGIVPAGSGNGLARDLGISLRPELALKTSLEGRDRTIDAGAVEGRFFFNVAGLGFDAHVARLFNQQRRRGLARYAVLGLRELWRYTAASYAVGCDGDAPLASRPALMVVIANSRQYGAGALIAPEARLDDGQLDLVVIDDRSPVASLWQTRRLFTGTLGALPDVLMRRARRVAVTSDRAIACHVDGEPVMGGMTLGVEVLEAALRVRVGGR